MTRTLALMGIGLSAVMLFLSVVNENAGRVALPFAILAGCSLIALALSEGRPK